MKPITICTLLILIACGNSYSQKPAWIDFNQRNLNYPKEKYLVGYYSANRDRNKPEEEQLKTLIEYAKTDILENITVSISSVSQLNTQQTGKSFIQTFSQRSLASAKAELAGLKTETWKDKKELYALAYVQRSDLISFYNSKLSNLQTNIEKNLTHAEQLRASDNKEGALDQYYQCLQQLYEAEQVSAIMLGVKKQYNNSQLADFSSKIRIGIESIIGSTASNPDDAALVIAEALKVQLKNNTKPITVAILTYQDTRMASPFSAFFAKSLESKLTLRGLEVDNNQATNSPYILSGTYWEEADRLMLMVMLHSKETGKVLATSETTIPMSWFTQNQKSFLPENFQEASIRQKIFSKDEITDGGLHIDLWTNKGDENQVFFENDTMKIYVRTNHECYLRFIYYMADSSKVLLMNDYYISYDKVNKVIEIPETFICSAPFGVESMQLNAQTSPFQSLNITSHDGYQYINDNVATIVAATRGFKKVSDQTLSGEKRLVITTIKEK
jgi:hypothetical protein